MERWRQPRVVYKDPYFSNPADVSGAKLDGSRKALRRDYGGRTFIIPDDRIRNTPPFPHGLVPAPEDLEDSHALLGRSGRSQFWKKWEYAPRPPSLAQIKEWLEKDDTEGELSVMPVHCVVCSLRLTQVKLAEPDKALEHRGQRL